MSTQPRILQRITRPGRNPARLHLSHRVRGVFVVSVYVVLVLTFFVLFVSAMTPSTKSIERLSVVRSLADRSVYRTQVNNRLRVLPSLDDRTSLAQPTATTVEAYEDTQALFITMAVPSSEAVVHHSLVGYLDLAHDALTQANGISADEYRDRLQQVRSQILNDDRWLLLP